MFIKSKKIDHAALDILVSSGLNPHLAKFYSARGIKHIEDATLSIEKIIPPEALTNNTLMASILADAILEKQKILIIGATSVIAEHCARLWAVRGDALYLVARNEERLAAIASDFAVATFAVVARREVSAIPWTFVVSVPCVPIAVSV